MPRNMDELRAAEKSKARLEKMQSKPKAYGGMKKKSSRVAPLQPAQGPGRVDALICEGKYELDTPEGGERNKRAVDLILRKLLNLVVLKSETVSSAKRLQETHKWLFQKIWADVKGHEFDLLPETTDTLHGVIFKQIHKKSEALDRHVLILFNLRDPETDRLIVSCFKKVLLSPRRQPFVAARCFTHAWRAVVKKFKYFQENFLRTENDDEDDKAELTFVDDYTGQEEGDKEEKKEKKDRYRADVDQLLLEVIAQSVRKSCLKLSPERMKEIHKWLFPKIWAEIEGHDFYIPDVRLLKIGEICNEYWTNSYVSISLAPVMLSMKDPVQNSKIISSFKKALLQLDDPDSLKIYFRV